MFFLAKITKTIAQWPNHFSNSLFREVQFSVKSWISLRKSGHHNRSIVVSVFCNQKNETNKQREQNKFKTIKSHEMCIKFKTPAHQEKVQLQLFWVRHRGQLSSSVEIVNFINKWQCCYSLFFRENEEDPTSMLWLLVCLLFFSYFAFNKKTNPMHHWNEYGNRNILLTILKYALGLLAVNFCKYHYGLFSSHELT